MPEVSPHELDAQRTNRAIEEALSRSMQFDRPPVVVKSKPRKPRGCLVAPQEPPLTSLASAPIVAG